jgi:hypothetical protein
MKWRNRMALPADLNMTDVELTRLCRKQDAEIERLTEALHDIADFEQDVYVSDKAAISYMRETAKSALVSEPK